MSAVRIGFKQGVRTATSADKTADKMRNLLPVSLTADSLPECAGHDPCPRGRVVAFPVDKESLHCPGRGTVCDMGKYWTGFP